MDKDGTKDGYDIELTRTVSDNVSVPDIQKHQLVSACLPISGTHFNRVACVTQGHKINPLYHSSLIYVKTAQAGWQWMEYLQERRAG